MVPSRLLAALLLAPLAAPAQDDPLARGRLAMEANDPRGARRWLEQAVRADSTGYEPNWRLALVLVDLGKETPDEAKSPARDSLYARAESYARRAVEANPQGADGRFVLANAIGNVALTKSKKERVERAVEIRTEALRALALDPRHDGALHVIGRWHAEIMRLGGVQKFFARKFLGADIFDEASWDEAERNLRLAVEYRPDFIYHRLDLAEVLADRKKWQDAKGQLDALLALPPTHSLDRIHLRRAREVADRVARELR